MALSKITNSQVATSGMPTGAVLQVVTATTGTQDTAVGQTVKDTGLEVSITPSSTSNKVFVTTSFNGGTDDAGAGGFFEIYRDSTSIMGQGSNYTGSGGATYGGHALSILDSPATTSSVTYKLRFSNQTAAKTARFNTDYGSVTGEKATIVAMEIAG